MLPFEKALEIVLASARQLDTERIEFECAFNRVLAEEVRSDIDIPPFNKSAMDGFACRRADLANELAIVETIPAGYTPTKSIGPNQCAKIMTGGVVPEGADCVVMKEYVEMPTEDTIRFVGKQTADNICQRAEDIKAGDVILHKGTLLKPHHIAVLASVGHTLPTVSRIPRVGIIATGSELVDPTSRPQPSQIRNSNSSQLAAQVASMGVVATDYGITRDTEKAINNILRKAIEENDVVIISGGVSVGDFDLVPRILKQNNIDLLFESMAVKPGKPSVFGVSEKAYCFGLPGNPMSTFVQFEILIKPFLYKLMGHDYKYHDVRMPLDESIVRKKVERQAWFPVAITAAGTVRLIEYHGSAHISSLRDADGLVSVDVGVTEVEKGTIVRVRLI
ncbi:MAG: molybdopterin molybdotransferase MoeA [Planctomycetota bacterium]